MLRLILIILLAFISQAKADYCVKLDNICIDASNKEIDGFEVSKPCWEYKDVYKCYKEDYNDNCLALSNVPGCEFIGSECSEYGEDGVCNIKINSYKCGDLLKQVEGSTFIESNYTISKDSLDIKNCVPAINPNCYELNKVCVEGAGTRNIDGLDLYKDCWRYESNYGCYSESKISNCEDYKENCVFIRELCLSTDKDGNCRHLEKTYNCATKLGNKPLSMQCNGIKYCMGGNCETVKSNPNQNFGKAVSALNILRGIEKNFESDMCEEGKPETCKVFKGESKKCKIHVANSLNCCDEKGLLYSAKLAECTPDEKQLALNKKNALCHYIGSYCVEKTAGVCLTSRQRYCCFDSKLSRIIQEQVRSKLKISWGSARVPNCRPLTISEIQNVDFTEIDLSELYHDLYNKIDLEKQASMSTSNEEIRSKATNALNQSQPLPNITTKEYSNEIERRIKQHYGQ